MTTSRWQRTDLAKNEILVKGDVQTLVEGETDWSYVEYNCARWREKPTWHHRSVYLHYKGYIVVHLKRQKSCFVEEHRRSVKYASLVEAVVFWKTRSYIQSIERWNRDKGIYGDSWCQERGTALVHLTLTLPLTREESKRLSEYEETREQTLEQIMLTALRALLQESCEVQECSSKGSVHVFQVEGGQDAQASLLAE